MHQELDDYHRSLKRAQQHLLASGICKVEAERFTSLIHRWVTKSGPQFAIDRLKAIKSVIVDVHTSGSCQYKVPIGWASRTNRQGRKIFKDPLLHWLVSQSLKNPRIFVAFCRLPSVFRFKRLTQGQLEKMMKAVTGPLSVPSKRVEAIVGKLETCPMNFYLSPKQVEYLQRCERDGSIFDLFGGTKKSPVFSLEHGSLTYHGSRRRDHLSVFDWEDYLTTDYELNMLWNKYPTEISERLVGNGKTLIPILYDPSSGITGGAGDLGTEWPAGTLVPIQEGAGKVRWIANPVAFLQALGEPLKKKLDFFSRRFFPFVYTHDQDEGRSVVQRWVGEGKTVYCFDATSFTDRLPWSVQKVILHRLQEKGVVSAFDVELCSSITQKHWWNPSTKSYVQWKVGQPLGFGPSFHLATLTHAILVEMLIEELNLDQTQHYYCIVGDDIVICDATLADRYQDLMTNLLGVEINLSKSVISDKIAEFLGKFIIAEGVIPATKVKLVEDPMQMTKLIDHYGIGSLLWIENRDVPLMGHAVTPIQAGGRGLIPKSLTYSQYLESLNLSRLADAVMRRELERFHCAHGASGCPSSSAEWIEFKTQVLERNTQMQQLVQSEWRQNHLTGGSSQNLNQLSCCEAEECLAPERARYAREDFTVLMDNIWKSDFQSESYHNVTHSNVHTSEGYISDNERPSTIAWNPSLKLNKDEGNSDEKHYQLHTVVKFLKVKYSEFVKELRRQGGWSEGS